MDIGRISLNKGIKDIKEIKNNWEISQYIELCTSYIFTYEKHTWLECIDADNNICSVSPPYENNSVDVFSSIIRSGVLIETLIRNNSKILKSADNMYDVYCIIIDIVTDIISKIKNNIKSINDSGCCYEKQPSQTRNTYINIVFRNYIFEREKISAYMAANIISKTLTDELGKRINTGELKETETNELKREYIKMGEAIHGYMLDNNIIYDIAINSVNGYPRIIEYTKFIYNGIVNKQYTDIKAAHDEYIKEKKINLLQGE